MTAQAAEPLAAMCHYLASTSVASLVGTNIFRPKLPPPERLPGTMPFACIVVRRAGGYALLGGSIVPAGDPRVEFVCYGSTDLEAQAVAAEVVLALRRFRQSVHEGTRINWVRIEGGPLPLTDPDTNWPLALVVAQVAHTEITLA